MNEHNKTSRTQLYKLLGRLPSRNLEISSKCLIKETYESFTLEKLVLELNGIESVPAYFLLPKNADQPVPAILYHHAHGMNYSIGKEEILQGRPAIESIPYGEELTRRGIAVLCIDTWAFGKRSDRSESAIFKEMLWYGRSMLGMMLFDSIRSLDYLASRSEIDNARIGTMGISMGSTLAWWTAALDTRLKVVVDICCLTDFHELINDGGLDRHGIFYYVPDLLNHFTTADINKLIAPRPHLSLAGDKDKLTPVKGLKKIDAELKKTYQELNVPHAWKLKRYNVGHVETREMRKDALQFLDEWL